MKTLKIFITALFTGLICYNTEAQSSVQHSVIFSEGKLQSTEFDISAEVNSPFARITAYILNENVETILHYRVKRTTGWSEWKNLEPFTEAQTEGRNTFDGGVIEESFNAIQFKSTNPVEGEFIFRVYYPNGAKKKSGDVAIKKAAGANCSCPQPPVCFRTCWCPTGNCPKDATPSYTQADHIIVHHSAGTNSSNNWPAVVSSIWDFHVNTNGWDDIGYNWLIDPNGVIYEGRGDSVQGAHFSCMNSETTGICLLGNFVSTAPADSAIASLIKMVVWEGCDKNIAPSTSSFHSSSQLLLPNVAGHRHGNASSAPNSCAVGTVCPGDSLFALLPIIRDSAAAFACLGDVSVAMLAIATELQLYPNPTQEVITLQPISGGEYAIKVIDHTGRVVMNKSITVSGAAGVDINVDSLPNGLYQLVLTQKNSSISRPFIKN